MSKSEMEKQIEETLKVALKQDLDDEQIALLEKKITTIRRLADSEYIGDGDLQ